jgi:dihydrolipoamide dehydrogenase
LTQVLETDIAVVGAGTAGVTAFHDIRRAGRTALLIDRGPLGTTCARVGCMPSKAVLHAGHDAALARRLGGSAVDSQVLWQRAIATRDMLAAGAANRTRTGVGDHLLMGTARFVNPHELDVDGRRVRARAFIVATGSRPVVPASLAGLGDRLLTTDTIFELKELPRSIGIMGLGAVGLELGLALSRLGVEVTAGDLRAAPAGIADPVVAERAVRRFGSEITMWLGRPITADAGRRITLSNGVASASVEMVLASLGRRPNIEALQLENSGVGLDGEGAPRIDCATLRAPDTSIFFAGDVHPDRALMHEAADEGVIAARGALALIGAASGPAAARRVPLSIVFSDPDLATVGEPYESLVEGRSVVGGAEGAGNGRSRILGAEDNLVRVYAERGSGRLLGASLMAAHGEHLAHLLAWAVQRGETVAGLLEMPYYHPSVEEMVQSALKDAARQLAA